MEQRKRPWFLLSSHGLCLAYVFRNPDARVSEIAGAIGLTERRTTQIIRDLEEADYLLVEYQGRRKRYSVNGSAMGRHPLFANLPLEKSILPVLRTIAMESSRTGAASGPINRDTAESRLAAIKHRQEELAAEYEALLRQIEETIDTPEDALSVC
jgi:hypothetical protein